MLQNQSRFPASAHPAHFLQLHDTNSATLIENVAAYVREGRSAGSAVLVIATPEHRAAFAHALGSDRGEADAGITFLDASETLARFMVDGYPSAERFEQTVGAAVRDTLLRAGGGGLRAYGEMVGVLWAAGQFPAAIRLEQLWHRLLRELTFSLFCAYPIDVFGSQFKAGIIDALICSHTHVLSDGKGDRLERAVRRALDDFTGAPGRVEPLLRNLLPTSGELPAGEALILWLRESLPDDAEHILTRAREYYTAAA